MPAYGNLTRGECPATAHQIRHSGRVAGDEDQKTILVRDQVSADIGLRGFIGRLTIERHRARFDAVGERSMTFTGPVTVIRRWLAPLGVRTDVVLGREGGAGNDEVVLTMGWRSASKVIGALRSAEIPVQVRRELV